MRKRREKCHIKQEELPSCIALRVRGRLEKEILSDVFSRLNDQKIIIDLDRLDALKTKDLRNLYTLLKGREVRYCLFSKNQEVYEMMMMSGLDHTLNFRLTQDEALLLIVDEGAQ